MRRDDFQANLPGTLTAAEFRQEQDGIARTLSGLAFVPAPLPPPLDRDRIVGRLYSVLDRAKSSLLRLEAAVDSLPDSNVLLRAMRLREVQASSRIENTVASLAEMALAEAGATSRHEALEVIRNREAIEVGLASKLPVSRRLLMEMHRALVGRTNRAARPGMFRDRQVYIGDEQRGFQQARFVPPPPGEIMEQALRDWELFMNPEAAQAPRRERWPELIELAMSHYQFEAIHPFSDGNGRLGRAIVNLAPVKSGMLKHPVCNLSEWIVGRRQEYYDRLLRVSTHNEWEEWVAFFCTALAEQAGTDVERAQRVLQLRKKYHDAVIKRRNSALLVKLIDHLFVHQGVTIPHLASHMGVSYPSAQKHVELLVSLRVLKQVTREKYGKLYIADGIIRAIRGRGED